MLGDVRDRLGDDVVDRRLDGLRQALVREVGELDRQRCAGEDRLQRRAEPAVGEDRGVDATRQLPQLVECTRELGLSLLEKPRDRVRATLERALGQTELQGERDEALLRAIVQVALQSPAPTMRAREAASLA